MIVISDTSPINYLLLIDLIELLPRLYTRVLIPAEVHAELLAAGAPRVVFNWASQLPEWCSVIQEPSPAVAQVAHLDAGERAAIQLALHLNISSILIDDYEAREAAESLNLKVRGTLGVLQSAAQAGQIDLLNAVHRLMQTNFAASPALIARVLRSI